MEKNNTEICNQIIYLIQAELQTFGNSRKEVLENLKAMYRIYEYERDTKKMIEEFVECWFKNKNDVENKIRKENPTRYKDLVYLVVEMLEKNIEGSNKPSVKFIKEIGGADYSGNLIYILGNRTDLDDSWYVSVTYGSCSRCDTMERIEDLKSKEQKVKDYMTLCLHIIQGIRKIDHAVGSLGFPED